MVLSTGRENYVWVRELNAYVKLPFEASSKGEAMRKLADFLGLPLTDFIYIADFPSFEDPSQPGIDESVLRQKMGIIVAIAGTSGSGKSLLLNEIAAAYLGTGAKVWIIDVGRSYEKACRNFGGSFIEFTEHAPLSLNPFTVVQDIDEDMELLQPLRRAYLVEALFHLISQQFIPLYEPREEFFERIGTAVRDEFEDLLA